MTIDLYLGDCLEVMPTLEAGSVDTIITDPPYGLSGARVGARCDCCKEIECSHRETPVRGCLICLGTGYLWEKEPDKSCRKCEGTGRITAKGGGFMGKNWDKGVPGTAFWEAALRVAKPGAMLLAFGGTRTHHRLMCAIEDAGWVIRDCIFWVFGSGFPKSLNISKALDKAAGAEREVVGRKPIAYPDSDCWGTPNKNDDGTAHNPSSYSRPGNIEAGMRPITAPATEAAKLWDGYGTALKPAHELIILAMKPIEGTFANNALEHGVAGLWIDGGRVEGEKRLPGNSQSTGVQASGWGTRHIADTEWENANKGRFPANLIHDGSEEVLAGFPESTVSGSARLGKPTSRKTNGTETSWSLGKRDQYSKTSPNDTGSAARFFYCAKSSRAERNAGLEGMDGREARRTGISDPKYREARGRKAQNLIETNHHPTVKPLALMRYLCKLTRTPTGGVILDPFMGSGTTGMAAVMENRDFIGIEIDSDYHEIAEKRINNAQKQTRMEI